MSQRPSVPIIAVSAILLIAASLACGTVAKPAPHPLTTPSASVSSEGTLIFHSRRDGNYEIYRVRADGTGLVNLTHDPGNDTAAVWSPDGKQIAFISDRSGQPGLYVMNSDSSNLRHLYSGQVLDRPAWSPDGKKIALSPGVIIAADGSGEPVTTSTGESCWNPAWSPNSAQIACDGIAVRNVDLTGRNVNPAGQTTSLMVRQFNRFPAWSPDSTRIAFLASGGTMVASTEICAVHPDLSGLARLSGDERDGRAPAWSPDGAKIAHIARQCKSILECGKIEILVMSADGAGKIRLTYNDLEENELAWSPDGARIAFAARPEQTATPPPGPPPPATVLLIINADGSAQRQLAAGDSGYGGLSWQPMAP